MEEETNVNTIEHLNLTEALRALLERPLTAGTHDDLQIGYCLLERHDVLQQIQRLGGAFDTSEDTAIDVDEVNSISYRPGDVAAGLRFYGVALNDALLYDGAYQRLDLEPRLRACEPLLTDTATSSPEQCARWGLMALDWLIRVYLSTWLRLVPALGEHADRLAALAPLTEPATDYVAIGALVRTARDAAGAAAGAAARATARATARDAAGAAAGAAARATARATAGAAARDAAWAAARAAAVDAAGDAARATARAAAGDAAGDAARAAAGAAARATALAAAGAAARDAAGAAASEQLAPTVRMLQDAALALFERMLAEDWRAGEEATEAANE